MTLSVLLDHDPTIVGAAAAILAVTGALLQPMLSRVVTARADVAIHWALLMGIVAGGGIWSVHFVAMLALRPDFRIAYLGGPTMFSLVVAVTGMTAFALLCRAQLKRVRTVLLGVVFACLVGWIHHVGMSGLLSERALEMNHAGIFGSIALAALPAGWGLCRLRQTRSEGADMRLAAGIGSAVLIVHFGSIASMFPGDRITRDWPATAMSPDILLIPVLVIAALILSVGYFGYQLDRQNTSLFRTETRRLRLTNDLSGLPNETGLVQEVAALIDADVPFVICGFSIARFRLFRMTRGEAAAQTALVAIGKTLSRHFGGKCFLAHGTEDRFYIVETRPDRSAASASVGVRVVRLFETPVQVDDIEATFIPLVGTVSWPDVDTSPEELLSGLDYAIDQSQEFGEGAVCDFDSRILEQRRHRSRLSLDFERAIAAGELELHYQPQMDVSRTPPSAVAFEVLTRWHHPHQGLISPGTFIPIAEETGQVEELGAWVLRTACHQAATWDRPLTVSVNVDPIQLHSHDFIDIVRSALKESHLPPSRLELEVTETGIIRDMVLAEHVLSEIRALGVRLALDDYGAGYSSMKSLYHIPFDKLKLDSGFVQHVATDRQAQRIVRAVSGMCETLGLTLIAEGVETREQLDVLVSEGYTLIQGHFFDRAIPLALAEARYALKPRSAAASG